MTNTSVIELECCRAVLLRAVADLSLEQLDYRMFPDTKSISEILLHVAGFEFLIASEARLLAGRMPNDEVWHKLKPGFSREVGFSRPEGQVIHDLLNILAEVREYALSYFGEDIRLRRVPASKFSMAEMTAFLQRRDPDGYCEQYKKLAAGVGASIKDDSPQNDKGEIDLVALLQIHETYHRGQITLQKYFYSQLLKYGGWIGSHVE